MPLPAPGQLTAQVADEVERLVAQLGPAASPEMVERLYAVVRAAADFDAFAAERLLGDEDTDER